MKKLIIFISLLLVGLLTFVPTGSVAAKGLLEGRVIFAGTYTLSSGETLGGDLVIVGGSGTLELDSVVQGDTVLVGGNLIVNGEVNGDLVIVGGALVMGEESLVTGDLITIGSSVNRIEGSRVEGEIFNTASSYDGDGVDEIPDDQVSPVVPVAPVTPPRVDVTSNPFWTAMGIFFRALLMGLLAGLVAVFMPDHTQRVSQAVFSQPVVAGGLGLLTVVVVPITALILTVTILLIPVAMILLLVWMIAMLFGWIALGVEIGARLARSSTNPWPVWLSAGLGTFILVLVANGVGEYLWCVGWMVPFVVTIVTLGGVVMTRFGTQIALPPAVVSSQEAVDPE